MVTKWKILHIICEDRSMLIYVKKLVAILFTILLVSVSAGLAGNRRALVIGVGCQKDSSWPVIHGDMDVPPVVEMLSSNGFTDIRTLVNASATKTGIVNAFRQLAADCAAGDLVYIHFSGHGQWMTDMNGDEPDGWDESWIPYDACRRYCEEDRGERHLCDDETAELLHAIRRRVGESGNIIVVADACHSGDSTREPKNRKNGFRGVYEKFIIPGKRGRGASRPEEQWLTMSACKDYQMNQEHSSGHGKLTYALISLRNSLAGLSNAEVLAMIDGFMQREDVRGRYPQSPVMTGYVEQCRFSMIFER